MTEERSGMRTFGEEFFGFIDEKSRVRVPASDAENLIGRPRVTGLMFESSDYQLMGVGFTDKTLIIGHGDGIPLNDPYPVASIREAVQRLGATSSSPLLRGMLEAYYGGCRDLWLLAVGPQSEYVEELGARFIIDEADGENFYTRYVKRLEDTFPIIEDDDRFQLIVPLHAPIFGCGDTDFLTPLADFCSRSFLLTGSLKIGLIGTTFSSITPDIVDQMIADPRLDALGNGRFVVPIIGSGVINLAESPTTHSVSPIALIAGALSNQSLDRGMTYARIPNLVRLGMRDFTRTEQEKLANARLNPIIRTPIAKRGKINEVVLMTDNTLGAYGTDYWSLGQVRLIMKVVESVRVLGRRYMGNIGYGQFKTDIEKYFLKLLNDDMIRGFALDIQRAEPALEDGFTGKVDVNISIQPYFGIRMISFTTRVGPGA